jgi:hypothetical protein
MKFGILKSIGHNIADSLACGPGLLIGLNSADIFGEAAATPEGFIEVDFLTGTASVGKVSDDLARALTLYTKEALPGLCARQAAAVSEFRQLRARFSSDHTSVRFTVTVEDQSGRRSTDDYMGLPAGGRESWINSGEYAEIRSQAGLISTASLVLTAERIASKSARLNAMHPAVGPQSSRATCRNTALPAPGTTGASLWPMTTTRS